MKYVRTDEGIIYVGDLVKDENGDYCDEKDCIELQGKYILKESDNLEDLCDEFVGIDDWNRHHKIENPNNIEIVKNFLKTFKEKYGAIWTNKGLIFVARMNDKGELELI